jgi:purine-nucleoside phosphorylase
MSGLDVDSLVAASTDALRRAAPTGVDWYVIAGSGLGAGLIAAPPSGLPLAVEARIATPALGFPGPGVAGHEAVLVIGRLGDARVAVQAGRLHPYEGHAVEVCTALLRAALGVGVGALVLTAAVGAADPRRGAGELVLLRDQINLLGPTPLVGPQFVDCSRLYDPDLSARLEAIAAARGEALARGVYAHVPGPQYETPTEVAALRALGADVVGMSVTYEAILAAAHGTRTVGLAVVTNTAGARGVSHDEVQLRVERAHGRLVGMLGELLARAPAAEP